MSIPPWVTKRSINLALLCFGVFGTCVDAGAYLSYANSPDFKFKPSIALLSAGILFLLLAIGESIYCYKKGYFSTQLSINDKSSENKTLSKDETLAYIKVYAQEKGVTSIQAEKKQLRDDDDDDNVNTNNENLSNWILTLTFSSTGKAGDYLDASNTYTKANEPSEINGNKLEVTDKLFLQTVFPLENSTHCCNESEIEEIFEEISELKENDVCGLQIESPYKFRV